MIYEELKQEIDDRASSPESMALLVNSLLDTDLDGSYLNLLHGYVHLKLRLHRIKRIDTRLVEATKVQESLRMYRAKLHSMRDRLGLTYTSRLRKRFF